MNKNWSGLFSLGLQSIEWQVKNLFQDCGGEKAVELMDKLATLPEKQRSELLESFINQASLKHKVASISVCANQSALQRIEDQIVADVSAEISKSCRFSVVAGGKSHNNSKLLDFQSAKREKENRFESGLN